MKKKSYRKMLAASVMIACTMLGTVSSVGVVLNDGSGVAYADVVSHNGPRSLTIYKYQVKDGSELGDRGNGEFDKSVDKKPLAGIKFKIQKVIPKSGGVSLVDPIKQKEGKDYTIDKSFAPETITTDSTGKAKTTTIGNTTAADGIYLVTELPDDRGLDPKVAKPADPFFVYIPQTSRTNHNSLIYEVVVQPKNILESLIEPDKTINDGDKAISIKAGQKFDWKATANVPAGLYYVAAQDLIITPVYNADGSLGTDITVKKGEKVYANYFTIHDNIDKKLNLDTTKLQVSSDGIKWIDLADTTDYNVTANGTIQVATAKIASGLDKNMAISLTRKGMEKVQGYKKIRAVFTTHSDINYNGSVANTFDVKFLTPGNKPINPRPEDKEKPISYTGGFDILKTAEDTKNTLAGAEFKIAETEQNAKDGKFISTNGNSYLEADLPKGVTWLTSTTTKDGHAAFDGLALIVGKDKDGNGIITKDEAYPRENVKKDYWVVETKAPDGYELIKEPKKVTVTLDTADNMTGELETAELNVVDKPKTDLPFTGGQGTTILVSIAVGAIAIGTVAIAVDKKRRQIRG
ncbi:MAG: SpaH/EbpB family LPXTG-anchored major pilin [Lactobacillales bacterium]|jgi:hypothetical protein|nr:SpaH/EbpB family LPXTG-anchored major pilin [Lactobacillales bacterium]